MPRRANGSLFRRRRPDGTPNPVWSIAYRAGGRRIAEQAYADRKASEQLLAQRLREVARDEVGLSDPYRHHRRRPLAEHLADFCNGIASRHRTEKHRLLTQRRLQTAFVAMEATRLDDLDQVKAETFLASLLRTAAPKTRDHYALALRQFGAWLLDTDRFPRNPFRRLRSVAREGDERRRRLALTPEQVLRLVEAAEVRPVARYRQIHPQADATTLKRLARDGRRRGLLYLFSALTGLRSAECRQVRWLDLELGDDGANSWVTPRAETTKAKRRDPLPLDPELARRLLAWRQDEALRTARLIRPTDAVFHLGKNLVEQLRKDAAYAGVPVVDEDGQRLDFHALRATYATLLSRAGVPLQLARRLVRHRDVKLTARHYEKLTREDLRTGSDQLASAFWRGARDAKTSANSAHDGATSRTSAHDSQNGRKAASP